MEIDINYYTYSESCKHLYNTNSEVSNKVSDNQVNSRVIIWVISWVAEIMQIDMH